MDFSRYDILVDNEESRELRRVEHEMMRAFNDQLDLRPLTRAEREALQAEYRKDIESRTDEVRAAYKKREAEARQSFFAECRAELGYGGLPPKVVAEMERQAEENELTLTDEYYFLFAVCRVLLAAGLLPRESAR